MHKPPQPPHQPFGSPSDRWSSEPSEGYPSERTASNAGSPGNPFGRAFHGPAPTAPTAPAAHNAAGAPATPRASTPSSSRLDMDADDELPGRLPPGFGDLARRVAETNLLVDRAISSIGSEQGHSHSAETLAELGDNLNLLFSQMYEGAADGGASPWHNITDSLRDLSEKIDRREQLRAELQMTQHSIDKAKTRLIDQIQDAARVEQERLSLTRMRSRLAAVMADKLLNKLR